MANSVLPAIPLPSCCLLLLVVNSNASSVTNHMAFVTYRISKVESSGQFRTDFRLHVKATRTPKELLVVLYGSTKKTGSKQVGCGAAFLLVCHQRQTQMFARTTVQCGRFAFALWLVSYLWSRCRNFNVQCAVNQEAYCHCILQVAVARPQQSSNIGTLTLHMQWPCHHMSNCLSTFG